MGKAKKIHTGWCILSLLQLLDDFLDDSFIF